MQNSMRVVTGAASAVLLGLGVWAPAQADPINAKSAFPVQIVCDNGKTYQAVANGSGAWTPAHDLNSSAMLIPVAFGEQTVTVTDPGGTVIDQETVPAQTKPGAAAHNKNATVSCSFSGSQTAPDGTTFMVEGTVRGFVTT
jgi:hypothetical protein